MKGPKGPALEIDDLRARGYAVHVTHRRNYYDAHLGRRAYKAATRHEAENLGFATYAVCPTGGSTEVSIYDAGLGVQVFGSAYCSDADNFNRRLGLRMALGRALSAFESHVRMLEGWAR